MRQERRLVPTAKRSQYAAEARERIERDFDNRNATFGKRQRPNAELRVTVRNTCMRCLGTVSRYADVVGTFQVGCKVENHVNRAKSATVARALVDTGSEYTWLPQKILERIGIKVEKKDLTFTLAKGERVTRSVGFAIIRVAKAFTIDEVVFAEPGDLTLLGARTLEGLSLVVDARRKKLIAAGPLLAA